MALFGRRSARKEIEEAKRAARAKPSPLTTANLIQKYIDQEDLDEALSAAEYGLRVYPRSSSIQQAYRFVKRRLSHDELSSLKEAVRTRPRPTDYQRLAELYHAFGDEEEAYETAEQGLREFPDSEGIHLVLGKMRYQRWMEDALPRDGLLAVEHLEKAVELNRENYKTLLALGKLYLRVGAKEQAEEKLNAILFLAPDDPGAREYLNTARGLPDTSDGLDDLLRDYFEHRRSREAADAEGDGAGQSGARVNKNARVLTEKVARFGDLPGFLGTLVLDRNDEVIASHFARGDDEMKYAAQVAGIYKAAQESSLRMDIGGFQGGYLECASGTIHMALFDDLLFILVGDRNAKADRYEDEMEKFLESTLYE